MSSVSAIVVTLNEERMIRECLKSIQWADEIIVVDSGSTDQTVSIAEEYATKVVRSEWLGFSGTKELAVEHATKQWILWIDADEVVSEHLSAEIRERVLQPDGVRGFFVPRKAVFLGKWIRHCGWYPGYVCRLFLKEHGSFEDTLVHESVIVDGPTQNLSNALMHYTDHSLEHYIKKFNRYTSLGAQQLHEGGHSFRISDLVFRPPFTFLKMYLLKFGFLDGIQGLILCVLSACYVFTKYAKLWHLCHSADHG